MINQNRRNARLAIKTFKIIIAFIITIVLIGSSFENPKYGIVKVSLPKNEINY